MKINQLSQVIDASNSYLNSLIEEYIERNTLTSPVKMASDIQEELDEILFYDGYEIDYKAKREEELPLDTQVLYWLESRIYSFLTFKGWEVVRGGAVQCAM